MNRRRVTRRRDGRPESGLLGAVFQAFFREAAALGIELPLTPPAAASRSRRVDPVSGDESIVCDWPDDWGQHGGSLVVNPDGSFYAEHEVRRRSPSDSRWFVQSIRAWGWSGDGKVRSEVRLSPVT